MERIFLRRRGSRRWRFCPADFTETTEAVCNPARGWYQIFTFYAEKEPDFKELEWCIDKRDALALVMINIGAFRDRSLKAEGLARIGRILYLKSDSLLLACYIMFMSSLTKGWCILMGGFLGSVI